MGTHTPASILHVDAPYSIVDNGDISYEWYPYPGGYIKTFYDIVVRGQTPRTIVMKCWPNAGSFRGCSSGIVVPSSEILAIRFTKRWP